MAEIPPILPFRLCDTFDMETLKERIYIAEKQLVYRLLMVTYHHSDGHYISKVLIDDEYYKYDGNVKMQKLKKTTLRQAIVAFKPTTVIYKLL